MSFGGRCAAGVVLLAVAGPRGTKAHFAELIEKKPCRKDIVADRRGTEMTFKFGFSEADLSDDEAGVAGTSAGSVAAASAAAPASQTKTGLLDELEKTITTETAPQVHSLESVLETLRGLRVSFAKSMSPQKGEEMYRRELFDIKHQVMCEDLEGATNTGGMIQGLLMAEGDGVVDIKRNVYEGGFKSWECSYDMVDALAGLVGDGSEFRYKSIVELGCGSALPACYVFRRLLLAQQSGFRMVFSDFNYEVLRLVTVPNLVIHWASTLDAATLHELTADASLDVDAGAPVLDDNELLFSPKLLAAFTDELAHRCISITLISGLWGRSFQHILLPLAPDLLLTSETIYALDILAAVADLIIETLQGSEGSKALVAAKHYYFGVGGSVLEFLSYIRPRLPAAASLNATDIALSQLKRSIVSLTF